MAVDSEGRTTSHPYRTTRRNASVIGETANWEGKPFKELAEAPVSALAGVSEKDAELLA